MLAKESPPKALAHTLCARQGDYLVEHIIGLRKELRRDSPHCVDDIPGMPRLIYQHSMERKPNWVSRRSGLTHR